MLDLPALPITFALTLWDATPIYLSVGLALAVSTRALLDGQSFHRWWLLRDRVPVEAVGYLLVFQPLLAIVMVATIPGHLLAARPTLGPGPLAGPSTPGQAIRARGSELLWVLLIGSLVAAVIKLRGPSAPSDLLFAVPISVLIGIGMSGKPGAAAIPAVAITVHLGGMIPASACLLATLTRPAIAVARSMRSHAGAA